jgi:hypothetical protein
MFQSQADWLVAEGEQHIEGLLPGEAGDADAVDTVDAVADPAERKRGKCEMRFME